MKDNYTHKDMIFLLDELDRVRKKTQNDTVNQIAAGVVMLVVYCSLVLLPLVLL